MLAIAYHDRYERVGVITDLEAAIQRYQEALQIWAKDRPRTIWTSCVIRLGDGYCDRYERNGVMADLETAIQLYQQVLDGGPVDPVRREDCLQSLARAHHQRHRRTGDTADLDSAILKFHQVLDTTFYYHPELAHRKWLLGSAYRDKYRHTKVLAYLDKAIELYEEALGTHPSLHPNDLPFAVGGYEADYLHSLGVSYSEKYEMTRDAGDMEKAMQQSQAAVRITPENHSSRAIRLWSLGNAYIHKYQTTTAVIDLEMGIRQYREALSHSLSPPSDRLQAGQALLGLYAKTEKWSLAYDSASIAMSLIPLLTPQALRNSDKQHLLTDVVGLASDAAAFALMAGNGPYEAIRLLELGRGVITGSLNELRADLSNLQREHPTLAQEYLDLRNQLDTQAAPAHQTEDSNGIPIWASQADQRFHASQKLETTIQTIRSQRGFDRFLMASSEDELKAAAVSGAIVIINASDYRCDALTIEKCRLGTLSLPRLRVSDLQARSVTLRNPILLDMELLQWLWDSTTEPILDVLGFLETPTANWNRIWWIPTGLLSSFPIHAAGYHSRDSTNTVLDRVISSYSSSVRAIIQSRREYPKKRPGIGSKKAILVGMERTPGYRDLQYASLEIAQLDRLCTSMQMQVTTPRPCRSDVLSSLRDCDLFHFAGHGLADQIDPSNSSLLLRDEPLTVANLLEIDLQRNRPYLAYLSACGTGQTKHERLADESLHLISACQLAGFRHVVGTLWEVNDQSCVDVATKLYQWIRDQGMSDEAVSYGLHRACRELRCQWLVDSTARGYQPKVGVSSRNFSARIEPPCESSQPSIRKATVIGAADTIPRLPCYWVPYVHYGI
ncbi:TPR domain-containing protein [Thozetella sp. PMI_491]|nr:TPR domain-containing protein [Thozetella sp. PMI_491]